MALPKIDKLSSEFTVSENDSGAVKNEIVKLGQAIFDKTNSSLKSATQSVIGDVPTMIKSLTEEIERGPVDSFGNAMNNLIKITQELGINLYDYNEGLAKSVEEFTGSQKKLEKKLGELREQGIQAEINEKGNAIKILTNKELQSYKEEQKIIQQSVATNKLELQERITSLNALDPLKTKQRKELEKEIITRQENIKGLEEENDQINQKTTVTADTGRDQGGFGKLAELKEAFMVIPDTIADVATGFADVGKSIYGGIAQFIGAPMKTLGKAFKGIANIFKTARLMIALKVLLIIAALQFVAENIGKIIGENILTFITCLILSSIIFIAVHFGTFLISDIIYDFKIGIEKIYLINFFTMIFNTLPITPGGLGLGELAFSKANNFFSQNHDHISNIANVIILFRIINVFACLPGAIIYVLQNKKL